MAVGLRSLHRTIYIQYLSTIRHILTSERSNLRRGECCLRHSTWPVVVRELVPDNSIPGACASLAPLITVALAKRVSGGHSVLGALAGRSGNRSSDVPRDSSGG